MSTDKSLYAQTPERIARASIYAAGGWAPDLRNDDRLIEHMIRRDPSLSYGGARGLITQIRDEIAAKPHLMGRGAHEIAAKR